MTSMGPKAPRYRHNRSIIKGDRVWQAETFLFVPGPTNVPDRILRAMASPGGPSLACIPRTDARCIEGLEADLQDDERHPLLFPSSGTGCWEAALTNCLDRGAKVLIARFGQFSHLWVDMCQRLGYEVELLETAWGEGAPGGAIPRLTQCRQRAPHQGRTGVPERDRHRGHERCGGHAARDGQRRSSGAAVRGRGERAVPASIFGWTHGAWTCASAARRRA